MSDLRAGSKPGRGKRSRGPASGSTPSIAETGPPEGAGVPPAGAEASSVPAAGAATAPEDPDGAAARGAWASSVGDWRRTTPSRSRETPSGQSVQSTSGTARAPTPSTPATRPAASVPAKRRSRRATGRSSRSVVRLLAGSGMSEFPFSRPSSASSRGSMRVLEPALADLDERLTQPRCPNRDRAQRPESGAQWGRRVRIMTAILQAASPGVWRRPAPAPSPCCGASSRRTRGRIARCTPSRGGCASTTATTRSRRGCPTAPCSGARRSTT